MLRVPGTPIRLSLGEKGGQCGDFGCLQSKVGHLRVGLEGRRIGQPKVQELRAAFVLREIGTDPNHGAALQVAVIAAGNAALDPSYS